jgi:pimeloyl-ACP methyl ester carboxylesterase
VKSDSDHLAGVRIPVLASLILLNAACAAGRIETGDARLPQRSIFVEQDGEGMPIHVSTDAESAVEREYPDSLWKDIYDAQLRDIMDEIRAAPQPNGVMLVIHGGLNSLRASRERTERYHQEIYQAGYNPIFVNWRTGALDSYLEQLFWVSEGHKEGWRPVLAPFYLVAHLGRGLTRAPLTMGAHLMSAVNGDDLKEHYPEYRAIRESQGPGQVRLSVGAYCRDRGDRVSLLWKAPLFPVRLGVVPFSDAFGTPSWDNMRRRTKNAFHQPFETAFTDEPYANVSRRGTGAVAVLMDSLSAVLHAEASRGGELRPVTLIGHSMGTIIANEIVHRYPALDFRDIVYMASAATIRDFVQSVVPYMIDKPRTRFYNLTLHPEGDNHETNFMGLAPGGSLLEYIDHYYANPETHWDRTLGKFENVIEVSHVFPAEIRDRITIKAFGRNNLWQENFGTVDAPVPGPTRHGEFLEGRPFWERRYWQAFERPSPDTDPLTELECR